MLPSPSIAAQSNERFQTDPRWLSAACGLSPEVVRELLPFYLPLAEHIAGLQRAKGVPMVVGIQGPQGAGKTSLGLLLQRVLCDVAGLVVATLSIDDLYLTRAERAELAARIHPLFQTRGVPGTHDVALGVDVLQRLQAAGPTAIPRFDKGRDDRAPEASWPVLEGPCDVVLFEGLWLGLPPLAPAALVAPVNELEAREDSAGIWRVYANRALAEHYPALFAHCKLLVHIQVPDFDCVRRWRSAAEHTLRARLEAEGADTSRVMDDAALARFFRHYERFTAHAMETLPEHADVILRMNREHRMVETRFRQAQLA